MRPNKVESAVQYIRMSPQVFARFSGHGNAIHNIILLLKKENLHLQCPSYTHTSEVISHLLKFIPTYN